MKKYYTLYLNPETVEKVRKEGKEQKRSLSSQVEYYLEKQLKSKLC